MLDAELHYRVGNDEPTSRTIGSDPHSSLNSVPRQLNVILEFT